MIRAICHFSQLSSSCVFFTPERSDGSGDRCFTAFAGRSSSLCLPSVLVDSRHPQQTSIVKGDSLDCGCSVLATEGVVPGTSGIASGSPGHPSVTARSTQTPSCSPVSPAPPRSSTLRVETVKRFARHLGLLREVAGQLSLCRRDYSS